MPIGIAYFILSYIFRFLFPNSTPLYQAKQLDKKHHAKNFT